MIKRDCDECVGNQYPLEEYCSGCNLKEYRRRNSMVIRKSETHELKNINPYFNDLWNGFKTFEVRFDDRDFRVGDILHLREYDPKSFKKYLGREILCEVVYILDDPNYLKYGFVIMSILIKKKVNL